MSAIVYLCRCPYCRGLKSPAARLCPYCLQAETIEREHAAKEGREPRHVTRYQLQELTGS